MTLSELFAESARLAVELDAIKAEIARLVARDEFLCSVRDFWTDWRRGHKPTPKPTPIPEPDDRRCTVEELEETAGVYQPGSPAPITVYSNGDFYVYRGHRDHVRLGRINTVAQLAAFKTLFMGETK